MRKLLLGLPLLLAAACSSVRHPETVTPVRGFDLDRYLGTWYEIARLDHPFERGLEKVTAEYTLREDGAVRVTNRGYSPAKEAWQEATGKAKFAGDPGEGFLKVSFFGPFYGAYVIFDLDADYQHAFVCGPDTSWLWLLSRTPTVSDEVLARFKQRAEAAGFDTDEIILVRQ